MLQGLAVVWVTPTAGSAVTKTDHRSGRRCGEAPRPLSIVAERRVSSCGYSVEDHSKSRLGMSQSATHKVVFLPLLIG